MVNVRKSIQIWVSFFHWFELSNQSGRIPQTSTTSDHWDYHEFAGPIIQLRLRLTSLLLKTRINEFNPKKKTFDTFDTVAWEKGEFPAIGQVFPRDSRRQPQDPRKNGTPWHFRTSSLNCLTPAASLWNAMEPKNHPRVSPFLLSQTAKRPNGKGFSYWEDSQGTWLSGRHRFGKRYVLHAWNIHYIYVYINTCIHICTYI